jgi:hypothetical protein
MNPRFAVAASTLLSRFYSVDVRFASEDETTERWNPMSSSGFEPYALKAAG